MYKRNLGSQNELIGGGELSEDVQIARCRTMRGKIQEEGLINENGKQNVFER